MVSGPVEKQVTVSGRSGSLIATLLLVAIAGASAWKWATGWGLFPSESESGYWALGLVLAALLAWYARLASTAAVVPSNAAAGMAIGAAAISGAFFLGLTGAVFAFGHDGLAYCIGLAAGLLLLQLVIAPRFSQSDATSLPDLFARRLPGRGVQIAITLATAVAMVALLAAQLMAAGLVGSRLLGLAYLPATAIAAVFVLLCFIVRGAVGRRWGDGALLALMILALLVPLVVLSMVWFGLPVPQIAYANVLWQVQGLEEMLLESDLADPAFLRPMMSPFVALTPTNFLGLVLGLALGVAVLPVLCGLLPAKDASGTRARSSALWALAFAVLLLTLIPAAAAFARFALTNLIAERTPLADLPEWIFTYGRLDLLHICGRAATDAATVAAACSELPDFTGSLNLQDVVIDADAVLLALPEMTGFAPGALGVLGMVAMAAAIVSANAALRAITRAFADGADDGRDDADTPAAGQRALSLLVAMAALVLAFVVASARSASVIEVAAWALVMLAATLFVPLLALLWWRRTTASGVIAAIVVGLAVSGGYLVANQHFPAHFYELSDGLMRGGVTAERDEYFAELKEAWQDAAPGEAKDMAWAELNAHARSVVGIWGINNLGSALLVVPASLLALIVGSLFTAPFRRRETAEV
ncbi:hypothetical protein APY04_2093 [Hyphomicrobium sulfonivorans]|uniref:Uncharacterized protein n=1 Tax=Hyphomicrobium sulfonivorans TaxID=121290 RepID=A0A109BE56_HYPSL|nr:hypothetical protein [Hyphomicrobium sulfonivorans]KWT67106.1 hypothetical protein APY04_2093 [Hyphomicrobium sulfonivorans]